MIRWWIYRWVLMRRFSFDRSYFLRIVFLGEGFLAHLGLMQQIRQKKMQKFSGRMDFIVIFWMSFFALTFWNMLSWEKHCRSFCILDVHTGLLTHKLRKWNWLIGPLIGKRDVAYEVLLKKKVGKKKTENDLVCERTRGRIDTEC